MNNNAKKDPSALWFSTAGAVIVTAAYVSVYQFAPLPAPWNDVFTNVITPIVAAGGAFAATRIWQHFAPTDRPRIVWRCFALGLWAWTAAEIVWAIYLLRYGEVPLVSLADVFWIAAYPLFAMAILHQYRLVFRPTPAQERRYVVGMSLVILVLSLAGTFLVRRFVKPEQTWLGTLLNVFYPLGDLALGVIALALARAFGRGLWARPWFAFLAFVVADVVYTWLVMTGVYAFSVASGNVLSLIADTLYLDAYVVLALACHAQLLLLRSGPRRR